MSCSWTPVTSGWPWDARQPRSPSHRAHAEGGSETFTITNVAGLRPRQDVEVTLTRADGSVSTFTTRCRIDTANEIEYFKNGGILQYVLRKLAA